MLPAPPHAPEADAAVIALQSENLPPEADSSLSAACGRFAAVCGYGTMPGIRKRRIAQHWGGVVVSILRPEMTLPVATVPTVRDIFPYGIPCVPIHVPTGRDSISGLRL